MLIGKFNDKVYIEHPYPGDIGTHLSHKIIVREVKNMFPFPSLVMGKSGGYHHSADEVFIGQDDHALFTVLPAQVIIIVDEVGMKIDLKLPGYAIDLSEMES